MQLVLDLLVPGIIAGVSCYGMAKKVDVYEALLQGAAKGLEILLRILPALVTLLTVVAMLRASGALELLGAALSPLPEFREDLIPTLTPQDLAGLSNKAFRRTYGHRAFAWRGPGPLRRNLGLKEE